MARDRRWLVLFPTLGVFAVSASCTSSASIAAVPSDAQAGDSGASSSGNACTAASGTCTAGAACPEASYASKAPAPSSACSTGSECCVPFPSVSGTSIWFDGIDSVVLTVWGDFIGEPPPGPCPSPAVTSAALEYTPWSRDFYWNWSCRFASGDGGPPDGGAAPRGSGERILSQAEADSLESALRAVVLVPAPGRINDGAAVSAGIAVGQGSWTYFDQTDANVTFGPTQPAVAHLWQALNTAYSLAH